MLIIEKDAYKGNVHRIQAQNDMGKVWIDGYLEVPKELEEKVWSTLGSGEVVIKDGVMSDFIPEEYPSPASDKASYIPAPEDSAIVMMRAAFNQQVSTMDDDVIIQCSGLAEDWVPGDHKVGEIYNAGDQTWECYQAYNNEVYPGVKPGDPSWYTFNRPLHGKSPETARPFVPVQGAHDMYRTGEYMVYTDGKTYRCKSDTNFSPDDYAQAWEVAA